MLFEAIFVIYLLMQKKENKEFAKVYDDYAVRIYNFIYYKTHHKETAEDLASQTFLKAFSKYETFDINRGSVSSWLYRIARNTVIDFYRTKKNILNIDDVWDLSKENGIERDFDTSEKLKEVKGYLEKLNSVQREIVMLRIWEGMSYKEIGEIIGKTEAGSKMAFLRTMQALKKEIPALLMIFMLLF